jgi:hypothetical protein
VGERYTGGGRSEGHGSKDMEARHVTSAQRSERRVGAHDLQDKRLGMERRSKMTLREELEDLGEACRLIAHIATHGALSGYAAIRDASAEERAEFASLGGAPEESAEAFGMISLAAFRDASACWDDAVEEWPFTAGTLTLLETAYVTSFHEAFLLAQHDGDDDSDDSDDDDSDAPRPGAGPTPARQARRRTRHVRH